MELSSGCTRRLMQLMLMWGHRVSGNAPTSSCRQGGPSSPCSTSQKRKTLGLPRTRPNRLGFLPHVSLPLCLARSLISPRGRNSVRSKDAGILANRGSSIGVAG